MKKLIFLILLVTMVLGFLFLKRNTDDKVSIREVEFRTEHSPSKATLFPIQCIDTMKVSRDRAKDGVGSEATKEAIRTYVSEIKSLGANCVAIGTPYNDEFLPVLRFWVNEARRNHLHVWFRGNWSEWEGWFGYPKNLTVSEHLAKTTVFIKRNPDLFEDGDIFTPSPEAENGGPFQPLNTPQKYAEFRKFLIDQNELAQDAFSSQGKSIVTNWLSMSGGVAKGVLDQETINQIGNVVTIDHYVKSKTEMEEFVKYFSDTYNADITLGEFGAPIPDINGLMTDPEQAAFVDEILLSLYKNGEVIKGVNYWTLSDSSTSLLAPDGSRKKVTEIIEKYYKPSVVSGRIRDIEGKPARDITIKTKDGLRKATVDDNGQFSLTIPGDTTTFIIDESRENKRKNFTVELMPGLRIHADITILPQEIPFLYRVKSSIFGVILE